jgi:hypothetical protein
LSNPIAVYDGRDCIGHVARDPSGQFSATTPDGRHLGLFTSERGASDAVWAATRGPA